MSTSGTTIHRYLDWLADTAQTGYVTVTAKVTAAGDHALTAVVGYRAPDPAPAGTVTLTATTPLPPPPTTPVLPVIAPGTIAPSPIHGKKVRPASFAVTRSDTGAALTEGGTMTASLIEAKGSPMSRRS